MALKVITDEENFWITLQITEMKIRGNMCSATLVQRYTLDAVSFPIEKIPNMRQINDFRSLTPYGYRTFQVLHMVLQEYTE
jgi:hypothetical protein